MTGATEAATTFYHGTYAALEAGDMLVPGGGPVNGSFGKWQDREPAVYFTPDREAAARYGCLVYEVEPVGPVTADDCMAGALKAPAAKIVR